MKRVKEWLKKPRYFIPLMVMLVFFVAGSTLAWFTDAESAVNTITIGNSTITVDEDPQGMAKNNIGITNTGNVSVYVRMRVDVPEGISYVNKKGELKNLAAVYNPATPDPLKWEAGNDGYWYYKEPLSPEGHVRLYNSISFEAAKGEMTDEQFEKVKALLDITVYGESVQSEGLPTGITSARAAFEYISGLN